MEQVSISAHADASVVRGTLVSETLQAKGYYEFECFDSFGKIKWVDRCENVITFQGLNNLLDVYLGGAAAPSTWRMSLATASAATTASSYANPTGVTEVTSAIIATRPTVAWVSASGGIKAATTTVFTIVGSGTVSGNLLVTGSATVGDKVAAGGILFSSAAFTSGSRAVTSGDTLNATYQVAIA